MRCVIERNSVSVEVDAYNNPVKPEFKVHLPAVPCRAWLKVGRTVIDGQKTAVIEDRRVLVPLNTDVTEADRISSITDRLGVLVFTAPMKIEHVGRHKSHLELVVTEIA